MLLRCALVDDEPLALGLLESYVRKTPTLELCGSYTSAIQALKGLPEQPVDLLFLDIQMPELNGLEYARHVPESTRIVFTTAFEQYALEGYRVNALDYLLKPISYADFLEAVDRAQQWFGLRQQAEAPAPAAAGNGPLATEADYIYVKSDYKLVQVRLDDILYIEGLKDYVKIHLASEPRPLLSLVSLRALEERLPKSRFLRVHRSFIVQKSHISVIEKGRIVFGKDYIPVSESYKQELQNYVNEHII